MRLLVALMLISSSGWAQNGEPSPAVRQQQKQADYGRKGHPDSGRPRKQEPASLKVKGTPAKPPKPKPGEASLRTPSK